MEKHKIDKIGSLKDEVKEFQPLLHTLFNKLPGISAVELRQGPNEKGADFVLTKNDPTLGSIDYVGVIVKTGSIKQNHQEVDRQIEECEMDRLIEGGKRRIVLNEIWVVSNDGITSNAQDAIHHKYKHKSIKFITGEKVCELIDFHLPEYWNETNIAIGNYLREVMTRSQAMMGGAGLISQSKKAILPYNFAKPVPLSSSFRQNKRQRITTALQQLSEANQFLFIDAMMGMGKSTALGQLAAELSSAESFSLHKVIPALYSFRDVIKGGKVDVKTLLEGVRNAIGDVPDGTRLLLMLDALDEVELDSTERVNLITDIYETAKAEQCSLIVTSREIDDPILVKEVEKRFTRYNILQLSISQVVSLVNETCKIKGAADRLKSELEKSVLFRSLPRTPISATLLTKILEENIQEIPSTMTELYSKYLELVLGRWDMSKGLQSQMEYDVIMNVSTEIAGFLLDNSLDKMSVEEARTICGDYVRGRHLKVDAEATFNKMIGKRELYFVSPIDGTISFAHRTFAEFFYAERLHRRGISDVTEKAYEPYWLATSFFRFGLKRDAPELLDKLDSLSISDEMTKLSKLFHHQGFLLAAYLTPYEHIRSSIRTAIGQAASFYAEVHANEKSQLRGFTEMELLCIFTKAVCSSYAYEYFKPALNDIATEIFCANNAEDRLLELFLVNSALSATSHGKAFDTMIDSYGPSIPLPLQIGIIKQSEDTSIHSDILDRYAKSFYRKCKGNVGMLKSLQHLSEAPLDGKPRATKASPRK